MSACLRTSKLRIVSRDWVVGCQLCAQVCRQKHTQREHSRMAYIGFIRPNVGAIPPMSEMQAIDLHALGVARSLSMCA
eukprot:1503501-Amphidinium_carterae.1